MATAIIRRKQNTNRGQRNTCTSLLFTTTFIRSRQNSADRNTGGERRRKRGKRGKKGGSKSRRVTARTRRRQSKLSENAEMVLSHGPKIAPDSRMLRVGHTAAFIGMKRRPLQGPAGERQGVERIVICFLSVTCSWLAVSVIARTVGRSVFCLFSQIWPSFRSTSLFSHLSQLMFLSAQFF